MVTNCESCGGPAVAGVLKCRYCGMPVSADLARQAIPCPQCREANLPEATQCVRCRAWVVVQCVFCGHLSPHTATACSQCNESFAGALERKAARDAAASRQQGLQVAGVAANVGAGLLGALAGAALGGAFSSSSDSSGDAVGSLLDGDSGDWDS